MGQKTVHLKVALIADHESGRRIEHHKALRHGTQGSVDLHLFIGERRFGTHKTLDMIGQCPKKNYGANYHEERANTNRQCMIAPARECCGFRNTNVDDEGIIPQRAYSHQTNLAVKMALRLKVPSTLRNHPIPR